MGRRNAGILSSEERNKATNGQINTISYHRFTAGPGAGEGSIAVRKGSLSGFSEDHPPKSIDSEFGWFFFFVIWLKILIIYSFKHPTFHPKIVEENNLPRKFLLFSFPSLKHFEEKEIKGQEIKM